MQHVVFSVNYVLGPNDEKYCKELAAVLVTSTGVDAVSHFIFKEPFSQSEITTHAKEANKKLISETHGLKYTEGHVPYTEFKNILKELCSRATGLYAFQEDDCEFLERATNLSVTSLKQNLNAPAPADVAVQGLSCLSPCHRVVRRFRCALTEAHVLAQWLFSHQTRLLSEKLCSLPDTDTCGFR